MISIFVRRAGYLLSAMLYLLSHYSVALESRVYQFVREPIDVIICCHEKDLLTLDLCIDGIRKCSDINRVIVISEKPLTNKAEWFDEKKFPFNKYTIALEIFGGNHEQAQEYFNNKKNRLGWIFQQLVCFYAPFIVPGISSNVLKLDADTIFMKPIHFTDDSGAACFNVGTEYHMPYFLHAEKVIPEFKKVFPYYSGISHHMLFQRCVLEDFIDVVRQTHGDEPWKIFCRLLDRDHLWGSCLSEFEMYFNFAFLRSNQFRIRPLKFINTGNFGQLAYLKNQGYDYVSCHSYLRE